MRGGSIALAVVPVLLVAPPVTLVMMIVVEVIPITVTPSIRRDDAT